MQLKAAAAAAAATECLSVAVVSLQFCLDLWETVPCASVDIVHRKEKQKINKLLNIYLFDFKELS